MKAPAKGYKIIKRVKDMVVIECSRCGCVIVTEAFGRKMAGMLCLGDGVHTFAVKGEGGPRPSALAR